MGLGDSGTQRQPDAAATIGTVAGLVHHIKGFGHAGQVGGRDAAAGIGHCENGGAPLLLAAQCDGRPRNALAGVLGVDGQIAQHIHPEGAVHLHGAIAGDDARHGCAALGQAAHYLIQQAAVADRFRRQAVSGV